MMESAALGWVSQILQHKVIAMASCCKRAMVRKGTTATAKHALERPGEEHQVTPRIRSALSGNGRAERQEIAIFSYMLICVSSHRYCNCLRTLKEGLPDVDAAYRCRLFWV
ncbi:hypothetical protein DVJ62_23240, partial [Klebsiella pneumoniae]|nr:hypothetical protein [Klebsiella pneumoniae]